MTLADIRAFIRKRRGFEWLVLDDADLPASPVGFGHKYGMVILDQGKLLIPYASPSGLLQYRQVGASSLAQLTDVDDTLSYNGIHFIAGGGPGGTWTSRLITPFDLPGLSADKIISGVFNALRLPVMVGDSGGGGVRGAVPAPIAGDATKFLRGDGTFAAVSTAQSVTVVDKKAQNVAQATYTAGAYRTMDLTHIVHDPYSLATINSNQVTLQVGEWEAVVHTVVVTGSVWRANLRLYNATAGTEIPGSESVNMVQSASVRVFPVLTCGFTLTAPSAIELQVFSNINTVANGTLNRVGKDEIYTQIKFTRLSA